MGKNKIGYKLRCHIIYGLKEWEMANKARVVLIHRYRQKMGDTTDTFLTMYIPQDDKLKA